MFRAVFLDRDGVIIENRDEYVLSWSDVEIFPQAVQALALFRDQGWKVVVVTNQSAVGRGLLATHAAEEINDRLVSEIAAQGGHIDAVYMCPHVPEQVCDCRKPMPGLLMQAAAEHALDLRHSWMIGDAWSDLQAGVAAGVKAVGMVRTGRGNTQLTLPKPATLSEYFVFNDLAEALTTITNTASNHP